MVSKYCTEHCTEPTDNSPPYPLLRTVCSFVLGGDFEQTVRKGKREPPTKQHTTKCFVGCRVESEAVASSAGPLEQLAALSVRLTELVK